MSDYTACPPDLCDGRRHDCWNCGWIESDGGEDSPIGEGPEEDCGVCHGLGGWPCPRHLGGGDTIPQTLDAFRAGFERGPVGSKEYREGVRLYRERLAADRAAGGGREGV
jgi:hypothetical protein